MKKVILHICCGVCAIQSVRRLKDIGFYVEGFFFNPNIYPSEEYLKRKNTAEHIGKIENIQVTCGEYNTSLWEQRCAKFASDKEGQNRCKACYRLRLDETYALMKEKGFDLFTTTLSISPHKKSDVIRQIAQNISEESFLTIDFKKDGGFLKTMELAKKYKLYRQNYCGCIYSRHDD